MTEQQLVREKRFDEVGRELPDFVWRPNTNDNTVRERPPEPPAGPALGSARRALEALEVNARMDLERARSALDRANMARAEADRSRIANPRDEVAAARAREARRTCEDAEADLQAFQGKVELVLERNASPEVQRLCSEHDAVLVKIAPSAVEPQRASLLDRARALGQALRQLDVDARELVTELEAQAREASAIEKELGVDFTRRKPLDYNLLRPNLADAVANARAGRK